LIYPDTFYNEVITKPRSKGGCATGKNQIEKNLERVFIIFRRATSAVMIPALQYGKLTNNIAVFPLIEEKLITSKNP
jgi:hypothetical protein